MDCGWADVKALIPRVGLEMVTTMCLQVCALYFSMVVSTLVRPDHLMSGDI